MGLPDVSINILNGQLGRTEGTADGVAGLVLTGTNTTEEPALLNTPKQVFGTSDAAALGISTFASYRHVEDFYRMAGEGAELWIMVVAEATTMTEICDITNTTDSAKKLLDTANGKIRVLGITRNPATPASHTEGLDPDVQTAVVKAQELAEDFADVQAPVRVMVEGRDFKGVPADIPNFAGGTHNRVSVIGVGIAANSATAAVGLALGRVAGEPVQRKMSRVRSGDLGLTEAFLTNGKSLSEVSTSELSAIHDQGVIVPRSFSGVNGFFFSGDQTATSPADDFSSLARGRVIDKARTLAYQTLVQEIDDDLALTEGQLPPVVIKSYKAKVETVLNSQMVTQGEASSAELIIDANQQILQADQLQATISIVPIGYASNILVDLKFDNPTV